MIKGEMLDIAILIAVNAHHGQFDKGGNPYILHPLKVMHYLKSDDEELQCIAVLHDVVEDCSVTFQDLLDAGLSIRVVDAIRCLTKQVGQSYKEYQFEVRSNRDAMLVKMADLRHNSDIRRLKGVTEKDLERVAKYQRFYMELRCALAQLDAPVDF